MAAQQPLQALRIDKWLWAARFFKTRALAAEAVNGGKVHVDGQRVKPARTVRVGDRIEIQRGHEQWEVIVKGLHDKRGPARDAQQLYEETEHGREQREQMALQRKLMAQMQPVPERRPSKRDRRKIIRFTRKQP